MRSHCQIAQPTSRWFAVLTQPNREIRAELQLKNQKLQTFLPFRKKTVRHARQLKTVKAPFFPRYLFVRLDPKVDRWRNINGTIGVSHLVMHGERPAPVPPGVIEGLMAMADRNGFLRFDAQLKVGEPVRLISGPLSDLVGQLSSLDEAGRVTVLLEIMGNTVPMRSTADLLVPA